MPAKSSAGSKVNLLLFCTCKSKSQISLPAKLARRRSSRDSDGFSMRRGPSVNRLISFPARSNQVSAKRTVDWESLVR